jgi:hypothetical protein
VPVEVSIAAEEARTVRVRVAHIVDECTRRVSGGGDDESMILLASWVFLCKEEGWRKKGVHITGPESGEVQLSFLPHQLNLGAVHQQKQTFSPSHPDHHPLPPQEYVLDPLEWSLWVKLGYPDLDWLPPGGRDREALCLALLKRLRACQGSPVLVVQEAGQDCILLPEGFEPYHTHKGKAIRPY